MAVYAITCPNCGGSLDILGGGRKIASVTCKYCGSVLDMNEEYKVLAKFKRINLPSSPFKLGMQGQIKGVDFTIIGMVAYSCDLHRTVGEDTWIDYLLYSPTHGYAWLSYESGNVIFSKTTHNIPSVDMRKLKPKKRFAYDGRKYIFYERYPAYITFVQGELTYIAKRLDKVTVYEAISPPYGLSRESFNGEVEYSVSELLDSYEVYKSFGIGKEKILQPPDFHPLRPFHAPKLKALAKVAGVFFVIALAALTLIFVYGSGKRVVSGGFSTPHYEMPFVIDDASHLVQLHINSDVRNDWVYFDVSIVDKNGSEVYSLGKEVSYYYGSEGGESWSEGSQHVNAYFKVPKEGEYKIVFDTPEYHKKVTTFFGIYEHVIRGFYFAVLLVVSVVSALFYIVGYAFYEQRLWQHLSEGDDD